MPTPGRRRPESSSKRADIVRAATTLFTRHGFRKTSLDLIASEAEVAKPTIYAYFADKDALFAGVCEDVVERVLADAQSARETGKTALERITGMLSAKFTTSFVLIESSPHGRELLDSLEGEAARIVEAADARYLDLLTAELRASVRAGELDLEAKHLKTPELARLLMQAAHGAGYLAKSVGEFQRNLAKLTALILTS
jgi:AcrR family transcriptional regulator